MAIVSNPTKRRKRRKSRSKQQRMRCRKLNMEQLDKRILMAVDVGLSPAAAFPPPHPHSSNDGLYSGVQNHSSLNAHHGEPTVQASKGLVDPIDHDGGKSGCDKVKGFGVIDPNCKPTSKLPEDNPRKDPKPFGPPLTVPAMSIAAYLTAKD